MLARKISNLVEGQFFKRKVIILYGARQVGKTTLVKMIFEKQRSDSLFLNCDEPDIRAVLTNVTSTRLKNLVGRKKIVFIDEAQRVKNIGITLKLFVDELPECQVIATGSSALGIADEISEPLTGRKYEYRIFPFSFEELIMEFGTMEASRLLEERVIYGMYPEIVLTQEDKPQLLKSLTSSYLFKDILSYQDVRRPEVLEKLLIALASQIGNQVSFNELSNLLKIDKETVAKYIDLLEKSFVIFKLSSYSRNLRVELAKSRKIYFYDTGIRNALISNFRSLALRQDAGALWENFLISERIKFNMNADRQPNIFFWRTQQQQEIDFIEEENGKLSAFEIKLNEEKKSKIPKTFLTAYPDSETTVLNRTNFLSFISTKKNE